MPAEELVSQSCLRPVRRAGMQNGRLRGRLPERVAVCAFGECDVDDQSVCGRLFENQYPVASENAKIGSRRDVLAACVAQIAVPPTSISATQVYAFPLTSLSVRNRMYRPLVAVNVTVVGCVAVPNEPVLTAVPQSVVESLT